VSLEATAAWLLSLPRSRLALDGTGGDRIGESKPKDGWLARRREQKRLKRERTGDSPEKPAEHQGRRPQDTTV